MTASVSTDNCQLKMVADSRSLCKGCTHYMHIYKAAGQAYCPHWGPASINGLEMEVISIDQSGGNTISQNVWAELAIMSSKISINQAQVQTRTGRVGEIGNWEWELQKQNCDCEAGKSRSALWQAADVKWPAWSSGHRRSRRGTIDEGRQQQHSQMSTTMLTS